MSGYKGSTEYQPIYLHKLHVSKWQLNYSTYACEIICFHIKVINYMKTQLDAYKSVLY